MERLGCVSLRLGFATRLHAITCSRSVNPLNDGSKGDQVSAVDGTHFYQLFFLALVELLTLTMTHGPASSTGSPMPEQPLLCDRSWSRCSSVHDTPLITLRFPLCEGFSPAPPVSRVLRRIAACAAVHCAFMSG